MLGQVERMRSSRQLERIERLPEVRRIRALIDGVVGIGLGVDRNEHDMREIASALSKVAVQGDRYPERLEQLAGR